MMQMFAAKSNNTLVMGIYLLNAQIANIAVKKRHLKVHPPDVPVQQG